MSHHLVPHDLAPLPVAIRPKPVRHRALLLKKQQQQSSRHDIREANIAIDPACADVADASSQLTLMLTLSGKASAMHKASPAMTPSMTPSECALCTKTIVSRLALKPCGQCDEELSCCSTCLRRHAAITLNDTPIGTTPRIFCPLCPPEPGRVRRLVTFDTLCRVLPPKELARCEEIGNSCTAFFCGGCHRQRHLNIDHKPAIMGRLRRANEAHLKASATAAKAPRDEAAPDPERLCWSHLKPSDDDTAAAASAASDAKPPPPSWESSALVTLERLKVGELNVSAAAESLIGTARDHGLVQGATLQQRLFDDVLPAIADPITRAALTHAVLRTLGDFRTPCCNRLHCFNCHVAGGHPGLTCDQFQAQRNAKQQGSGHTSDIDIVTCPKCFVSLVKGDGCMSVTCPCGHSFDFSRRILELRQAKGANFEGLLGLEPGANQWEAWVQLATQATLLAGDGGGGGEGGGAGGDLAQLAGEWLKLNAANIKRRMVRHFGRARAGSAVMLHSSTGRTAAIVQRVVAPSTHWPNQGTMQSDDQFTYEVVDVLDGGRSSNKQERDARLVSHALVNMVLRALRATAAIRRASEGGGDKTEVSCAKAWLEANEGAEKQMHEWEGRLLQRTQHVNDLANFTDAEVLGVHRLVSSIGCYLADAIVVMLAVRNVDVARRLLRAHCTPNSHPLLQAAMLRRAMRRFDAPRARSGRPRGRTPPHAKPPPATGPTVLYNPATGAFTTAAADYGDGGSSGLNEASAAGGSGEAMRTHVRLSSWVQGLMSKHADAHEQLDLLETHLAARAALVDRLAFGSEASNVAALEMLQWDGMRLADACDLLLYTGWDPAPAMLLGHAQRPLADELSKDAADAQKCAASASVETLVEQMAELLNSVCRRDLLELRHLRRPPRRIVGLAEPLCLIAHAHCDGGTASLPDFKEVSWDFGFRRVSGDHRLLDRLHEIGIYAARRACDGEAPLSFMQPKLVERVRASFDSWSASIMNDNPADRVAKTRDPAVLSDHVKKASNCAATFYKWLSLLLQLDEAGREEDPKAAPARRKEAAATRRRRLEEFRNEWTRERPEWRSALAGSSDEEYDDDYSDVESAGVSLGMMTSSSNEDGGMDEARAAWRKARGPSRG